MIRSLDGKSVREIPHIGESNHVGMWSPDGKSIAFQVREDARNFIAVVQSDGKTVRVFREALSATGESVRWSPDSRSIGFLDPGRHEFRQLNIATGGIRTVASDSIAQVGVWIWRPDGRSIAAVMTMPGASPGLRFLRRRVDEITLNGERRALLDTIVMRGVPGVTFIDPYTIFVRYDSAAYRMPLSGGPPQRVAELSGTAPATGVHTTAPTGDLWAGLISGGSFDSGRIEFISVRTGERRVVVVPFRPMMGPSPGWTPSGRELIVAGRPPLDTTNLDATTLRLLSARDSTTMRRLLTTDSATFRLYRVPVNGGEPRPIAAMGRTDGWTSVSPDGKWIVYGAMDHR
ncbi:MAG TPA: hypothetical protein VJ817_07770 [Gemmatimonadales bacterium]|nr:hypothetical protein [Gemmatimonadales bacterium]